MEELNTFRFSVDVGNGVSLVDLGDRFVISQSDDESVNDIHIEPDHALALCAAIMSRLNA